MRNIMPNWVKNIVRYEGDEDIGCNCGKATFCDGEVEEEYIPDNDDDGTRLAMSAWG